jgi:hypothetical protein
MPKRSPRSFVSLALLPALVATSFTSGCSKPKTDPASETDASKPGASAELTSNQASAEKPTRTALAAFSTDAEIREYYKQYQEEARRKQEAAAKKQQEAWAKQQNKPVAAASAAGPASPAPPATAAPAAAAESRAAEPAKADKKESITNNQTADVDEGGIVKTHGDHLVILRRGRLFTVRVDGKNLTPIAAVDAFGPGIDPNGTWYDEMLVSGDTLVVIGYSYARGGTEVGVFDLDSVGGITYRSTYHLRGNDYYSARNYASRVVGQKLVFYTPSYLYGGAQDMFATFPAVRKWHAGAQPSEFMRVVPADHIYKPAFGLAPQALHTVTTCDLAAKELSCKATSILGPAGRVFYVSSSAVYVWMTEHAWDGEKSTQTSGVVKLPLDGSAPGAVKVSGGPIDQFSFLEEDGHLDVLVRAETNGEGMWGSGFSSGDVAMLRLPLGFFSEGSVESSPRHYTRLEGPKGYGMQNRFVGRHVLYGAQSYSYYGNTDKELEQQKIFAFDYAHGKKAVAVPTGHSVDRIEALGSNAIVVGQRGQDLHFSSLALKDEPKIASVFVRKSATQAEQRSHGFFYKPETEDAGLLGLPVLGAARSNMGGDGDEGQAKVLFLKNQALDLTPAGELTSHVQSTHDACRASCVDWYGNARPIFLRGRIFGLMGYEIVEGALEGGHVHEVRRVSFAPKLPAAR